MIYLDLDGPMVNWHKGVFDLFGRYPQIKPGQDASHSLGIKKGELWARITKAGADWWANLEPQPWARKFYEELIKVDEVVVLTSPSHIPSAAAGKTQWMKDFFGGNFRDYILTSRKELLAQAGTILIDDHDDNIDGFNQHGGVGVLFPRYWNKGFENHNGAVEVVSEVLAQIYPRFKPQFLEEELREFNLSRDPEKKD